ncbi:MAG: hypothetical protein Q7S39_10220 [Ignavibacteria bacterium]|nr:hypothetical protein [Ignavibacteria bacterium]
MPNTLAHIGVAGFVTRSVITAADLKWIYLGGIIPDLPWMFQRLGWIFFPNINLYDLRLYVIIQSTLLFGIIISLALASLSKEYLKTFLILALGCLIHLLLDSLEIKWANGVHLFAPLNWELLNFNLFWNESIPIYLITLFGLVYFLITYKKGINTPLNLELTKFIRWFIFLTGMLIYFLLPLFILNQPLEANNHFVKTLENVDERPGKYFEIDRRPYRFENGIGIINTFTNEDIELKNINLNTSETISIKAIFIDEKTAEVIDYHVYSILFRDGSTYIGLAMIFIYWIFSFYKNKKN